MTSTSHRTSPGPRDWLTGAGMLAAAVYLFWVYAEGQWAHTFFFLNSW